MKKINWKKGAVAAVTAGLMMSALPTMAMAATSSSVDSTNTIITKTWTAATNAQLNDTETFLFNLAYVGFEDINGISAVDPTGVPTKPIELTANWQTLAGENGTSASAVLNANQVFKGVSFSKPGFYNFTLTEVDPANDNDDKTVANNNIVYDTTPISVRVAVSWGGAEENPDFNSTKVVWASAMKNGNKKEGSVNNGNKAVETLKVQKNLSGLAADDTDTFPFTIKLSGVTGDYQVALPDGTTAMTSNGSWSGNLGNGESVSISNLPVGASYTITETDNDDYSTTATVKSGTGTVNNTVVTGSISADDSVTANEVVYVNSKGFPAPTGVTMQTIPYIAAGGVAVAGAVTLVISRNRRQHEDF